MNPFSAKYSPDFPGLLQSLNGSILFTTYQTGKVILLDCNDNSVNQLVRDFDRPMGVSLHEDIMAMGLRTNITIFKNSKKLAASYPKKQNIYDTFYYPTSANFTGDIDVHDITFSRQGLIAVNTAYSCLARQDCQYSFVPIWSPPFIKTIQEGDACHLNGLCVDENFDIRYVTAFGKSDTPGGWRMNKLAGGFLYDLKEKRYLCENLPMPHSPRVYNNQLYVLLSGSEEFVKINRMTGKSELITKIDGFIRGLSFFHNYAFIGISKLRKSHTFGDLGIARKKLFAGIVVIDIEKKEKIAELFYDEALEEIYDVVFIPGSRKVNIINQHMIQTNPAVITSSFSHWITKEESPRKESRNES